MLFCALLETKGSREPCLILELLLMLCITLFILPETTMIIQLADHSNAYPKGVIEDVLVQVNKLVFPVEFYVLDMEDQNSSNPTLILLGKPFLKMA